MTHLPIDYTHRPWRPKYLDEETPELNFWFIFGESADGSVVDISDPRGDVFVNVPRAIAEDLIQARRRMIDTVLKYFSDFNEPNREEFK